MSAKERGLSKSFEGPHKTTTYDVDSVAAKVVNLSSQTSRGNSVNLPADAFPILPRKGHKVKLDVTIEDPITRSEWAKAFATQGASDLQVYEILTAHEEKKSGTVPSCHRLHYLQMATEKIAKSYLVGIGNLSPRTRSHIAVANCVKIYYRSAPVKLKFAGKNDRREKIEAIMLDVAHKIEQLNPAVDDENVPANVEYPWSMEQNLVVPCRHKFEIENLAPHVVKQFVQMLRDVATEQVGR